MAEEKRTKEAAINPALFADDAVDAYIQYTAAKKQMDADAKKKALGQSQCTPTKQAGMAEMIEPGVEFVLDHPGIFKPSGGTLAATAAGLASSLYGPEWAGGPTEEDIACGKRFNGKRAVRAVLGFNTVGKAVATAPLNAYNAATSEHVYDAVTSAGYALPGIVAGASIASPLLKGKKPDMKKVVKRYFKTDALATPLVFGGMAFNPTIQELAKKMFDAANVEL